MCIRDRSRTDNQDSGIVALQGGANTNAWPWRRHRPQSLELLLFARLTKLLARCFSYHQSELCWPKYSSFLPPIFFEGDDYTFSLTSRQRLTNLIDLLLVVSLWEGWQWSNFWCIIYRGRVKCRLYSVSGPHSIKFKKNVGNFRTFLTTFSGCRYFHNYHHSY